MSFNSEQANVNKFTIYFSPTYLSLQFLNRGYRHLLCRHTHTNTKPAQSRQDYPSTIYEPRKIALFFSSIRLGIFRVDFTFERNTKRKVKLSRLELKLRILIIVASHVHFHNHDKIAIFTATGYLYHGAKFYFFNITWLLLLKFITEATKKIL